MSSATDLEQLADIDLDIQEIWENQRCRDKNGLYGSSYLAEGDPARWSTITLENTNPTDFPIPPNFSVLCAWLYLVTEHTDSGGWIYATNFTRNTWKSSHFPESRVRRRKWVRVIVASNQGDTAAARLEERSKLDAESRRRVIFEGFLTKQGSFVASWRERWFVLRDGKLQYFAQRPVTEEQYNDPAKGEMSVMNAVVYQVSTSAFHRPNCFRISTAGRDLFVQAKSLAEMEHWADHIERQVLVLSQPGGLPISGMTVSPTLKISWGAKAKDVAAANSPTSVSHALSSNDNDDDGAVVSKKVGFSAPETKSQPNQSRANAAGEVKITGSSTSNGQTPQPIASTSQPIASVSQPIASVSQPIASTSQPIASVSQPIASTSQPIASTSKPIASVSQPIASVSQPIASTSKPIASVSQPIASTSLPVVPPQASTSKLVSVPDFLQDPLPDVRAPARSVISSNPLFNPDEKKEIGVVVEIDPRVTAGVEIDKKVSSEILFRQRFVWVEVTNDGTFHWSRNASRDDAHKQVSLRSLVAIHVRDSRPSSANRFSIKGVASPSLPYFYATFCFSAEDYDIRTPEKQLRDDFVTLISRLSGLVVT